MDWAVASQNFSALMANKEFEPHRLTTEEVEDAIAKGKRYLHKHLIEAEAFRQSLHFLTNRTYGQGGEDYAECSDETDEDRDDIL